jgi:hypothetical protein
VRKWYRALGSALRGIAAVLDDSKVAESSNILSTNIQKNDSTTYRCMDPAFFDEVHIVNTEFSQHGQCFRCLKPGFGNQGYWEGGG